MNELMISGWLMKGQRNICVDRYAANCASGEVEVVGRMI